MQRSHLTGFRAFATLDPTADSQSTVYNAWHQTELERWLSDHNVPYPTPADRKDLQNLVKTNWNQKVGQPYNDWSPSQLQSYLKTKGVEASSATGGEKKALTSQVKGYWTESLDSASNAYGGVKDWVFDRYEYIPTFLSLQTLTYQTAGLSLNSSLSSIRTTSQPLSRAAATL